MSNKNKFTVIVILLSVIFLISISNHNHIKDRTIVEETNPVQLVISYEIEKEEDIPVSTELSNEEEKISVDEPEYISFNISNDTRKSYMDYRCITSTSSPQYILQQEAYTETNGVRAVDGRYCIAVGSYYTTEVGAYVDLVLENGTIIPCIIGDCKQDIHTVDNNKLGLDGGLAEFVVDTDKLNSTTLLHGDVSYSTENWLSNVVELRLYETN